MLRLGLAFLIAFLAGGSVRAASPDPKELIVPPAELAKARELVRLLGSEDYEEREDAQKSLAQMGRLARSVLAEAAYTNPSAEVRSRAARLLPRAEAEELKARLDTFLADDDLQYEHELPGWAEFRIAAGTEWRLFDAPLWRDTDTLKAARTVYIELLEDPANRNLIYGIGGSPHDLGQAIGARKAELYAIRLPGRVGVNPARRVITAPDVIALIFAESQIPSRYIPTTTRVVSINVLLSPVNISGLDGRPAVFRNVVAHWMESRDDSASLYQALLAASSLNMPGPGTRIAVKLLNDPKAVPMNRAQAIVNLVRFDATDALPALEKAMLDPTVVSSALVAVNVAQPYDPIQIRDVALVAALVLNRQRPEDYGFIARANYGSGTTMSSYMQWAIPAGPWSATFTRRALALSKWAEWREQNLGSGKDEPVK